MAGLHQAFSWNEVLVITGTQSENAAAPQITEYVIQIRYLNSNLLGIQTQFHRRDEQPLM